MTGDKDVDIKGLFFKLLGKGMSPDEAYRAIADDLIRMYIYDDDKFHEQLDVLLEVYTSLIWKVY